MPITIQCVVCDNYKTKTRVDYVPETCSFPCSMKLRSSRKIEARRITNQPIEYKLIGTPTGRSIKVSNEDYNYLMEHCWSINSRGYVTNGNLGTIHTVIARRVWGGYDRSLEVDHDNMDKLDNQRSNLRLGTKSQNQHNRVSYKGSSSQYKGVTKQPYSWSVKIKADTIDYYIGAFKDEAYAANIYDQWAVQLHTDYARLNFDYFEVPRQ